MTNVFAKYSIGPITVSDVFDAGRIQITPRSFQIAWFAVELLAIVGAAYWAQIGAAQRAQRNEIALMGIVLSIVSMITVMVIYRKEIFDRYHFPAILGFATALAICFPPLKWNRLGKIGLVYLALMGTFSTLALHDEFRWQEARRDLLRDATKIGLRLSDIYAGFEPDGWNRMEGIASSPGCRPGATWFCSMRRYRIGVKKLRRETVIVSRPVHLLLVNFPDLKILDRPPG
jgi:hypothetical protein